MLNKILEVKKAETALNKSIICLSTIDENGESVYKFLTNVDEYIEYIERNKNDTYDEYLSYGTYDVLERTICDKIFLPGFIGEVFSVVSLISPKYSSYLKTFNTEDYIVDYKEPVYCLESFEEISSEDYSLYDKKGRVYIDGVNASEDQRFAVSNFKKDDFKESYGYIYLGEKTGVKFFSERVILNFDKLDKELLGIKEKDNDKSLIIKVLMISLGDNVVDFIALNENEVVEQEKPYDDSDFDVIFPDVVPYEGSIEEVEDWGCFDDALDSELDDIDGDMDEEFDVEVEVEIVKTVDKMNDLDAISDIDDEIDLGDI